MIEELVKQPSFSELSSFFKCKIKPSEREAYNKSLFKDLNISIIACFRLMEVLDNHEELAKLMTFYANNRIRIQDAQKLIRGEWKNIGKLSDNRLIGQGIGLYIVFANKHFPDMPKGGFFCNRNSEGRRWLKEFYVHVTEQSEKYQLPFGQVLEYNVVTYLLKYHNDLFYIFKDERRDEYMPRIFKEFLGLFRKK